MQAVREPATGSSARREFREAEVIAGLVGGTQVSGWLRLPSAWRVQDLVNNVREPVLTLTVGPQASEAGTLTLTRANIAWIGSLHSDPDGTGDNDTPGAQSEHLVVVHVGPFELRGTITTHREVQWSNFLVGRAGPPAEFFVLTNASIVGTRLPITSLAVNVGQVGALLSLNTLHPSP